MDYKIPLKGLKGEQKDIAESINRIGDGLDAAVEAGMKNERLKTDLITNVSHDIKTPLTSIINYIDLMKRENIQDPKIQSYLEVLEAKAPVSYTHLLLIMKPEMILRVKLMLQLIRI